ncbi:DUF3916 domain-containing protein [Domibacillus sp. DTU_2020_1001157_1_SI_ALB_TIR_016]|uniref:DUF3916 domain-containing protein n=1 Tax=Domibacillus sp. DTU_2020_1001157_1_SI_ALB_TIR_016 TaxID=3077789 RepID=UPI003977C77F
MAYTSACSPAFNSEKMPAGNKRLCMQALIDRAVHLINIKRVNQQYCRVVDLLSHAPGCGGCSHPLV